MKKTLTAATLVIVLSMLFSVPMDLFIGRAWPGSAGSAFSQVGNTVSISDATLVEGNAGTTNMVFTVTLTAAGAHPTIGVDYATVNGPPPNGATATQDYLNTTGLLVFPQGTGNASMTVSVPIVGDTAFEPDEIFLVNVTIRDSPATIGDGQGVGTIINDDTAPVLPSIVIGDGSIAEGSSGTTDMLFTVTLISSGSHPEVLVRYESAAGVPPSGATPGQDFQSVSGTLRFPE
jgi:chitinase